MGNYWGRLTSNIFATIHGLAFFGGRLGGASALGPSLRADGMKERSEGTVRPTQASRHTTTVELSCFLQGWRRKLSGHVQCIRVTSAPPTASATIAATLPLDQRPSRWCFHPRAWLLLLWALASWGSSFCTETWYVYLDWTAAYWH